MPTERTAELFIATARGANLATGPRPRHRLTLTEGFRPVWAVVGGKLGTSWRPPTVSRPDSPDNLFTHALLAYLAHAHPEELMTNPAIADLVTVDRARGQLVTSVPDDEAVQLVAETLPGRQLFLLSRYPRCGVKLEEADRLAELGRTVITIDCKPRSRAARWPGLGGSA